MLFNHQLAFKTADAPAGVFQRSQPHPKHSDSDAWTINLSQLTRRKGLARIVTYSLPDVDYVKAHLGQRPDGIWLICHSKFQQRAIEIKSAFKNIKVAVKENIRTKVLLIEPESVYLTIGHFENSGWHDVLLAIHSKAAHDEYVADAFKKLWDNSKEISA